MMRFPLQLQLGLSHKLENHKDDAGLIDVGKVNHNLEVDGGKTTPKIVLLLVIILKSYLLITGCQQQ